MPLTVTTLPVPAPGAPPPPDLLALVEVERAHHGLIYGHEDIVADAEAIATGLQHQGRTGRVRLLARDGQGRPVGAAHVTTPLQDNQHLGLCFLNWHPGSGVPEGEVYDALWPVADQVLRESGRTSVQSWALHPAPPDPGEAQWRTPTTGSGRVAEDDRARWFIGRGFELEQVELYSVLHVDEDTLDRARAALGEPGQADDGADDGADDERGTAYRTRTWTGATPPELRGGMARLRNRMSTDTPSGGIDHGEERWDADDIAALDERLELLGDVRVTTVALDGTGEPVAYTVLDHAPSTPTSATQDDTLVHGGHRGHGLGLRVKAINLLALREAVPTVRRVHTWNAAENTHMLAINTALGFREAGAQGGWQRRSAAGVA